MTRGRLRTYSPGSARLLRSDGRALSSAQMWTDAWKASIRKLDDRFGDFVLVVICPCGHRRSIDPKVLAKLAGVAPDTLIDAVVPRMRCMQCQQKGARWDVERKPSERGRPLH